MVILFKRIYSNNKLTTKLIINNKLVINNELVINNKLIVNNKYVKSIIAIIVITTSFDFDN